VKKKIEDLLKKKKLRILKNKKAEKNRHDRKANEKQARKKRREEMLRKYRRRIKLLREEIYDLDVDKTKSLLALEKRSDVVREKKDIFENKMNVLDEDIEKDKETVRNKKEQIAGNKLIMQQLKRKHKKLEKAHWKVQKQKKNLSLNNGKLEGSVRSGSSTFSETLPGTNNFMAMYDDLKDDEEMLLKKFTKRKREIELWQNQYWEKASMRLEVEKGLEKIVTLIEKKGNRRKIVKLTKKIADKCYERGSLIMGKLDAEFGHDKTVDPTM